MVKTYLQVLLEDDRDQDVSIFPIKIPLLGTAPM